MPNAYVNLVYHTVFSTKHRRPFIKEDITDRLYAYLGAAIEGEGGRPIKIGGIEDHLHIVCYLRQDVALSDVLRRLKSNSTSWVHANLPGLARFAWQEGYAAFTVSQSNIPGVSDYIAHQREHHRKRSFREELEELFAKHGIKADPRFFER